MTVNPVIGQIVTGSQVEQAVQQTLQRWFTTYLRELERQTGRAAGVLDAPRAYTVVNEFAEVRGMQRPTCIIVSTGTGTPVRSGDGRYDAEFAVGVAVIVKAATRPDANDLGKLYAAAVRTIVAQNGSLGGFAASCDIGAESYDDISSEKMGTAGAGTVAFTVRVAAIVDGSLGPPAPIDNPAPFPHVSSVDIDVEREDITP